MNESSRRSSSCTAGCKFSRRENRNSEWRAAEFLQLSNLKRNNDNLLYSDLRRVTLRGEMGLCFVSGRWLLGVLFLGSIKNWSDDGKQRERETKDPSYYVLQSTQSPQASTGTSTFNSEELAWKPETETCDSAPVEALRPAQLWSKQTHSSRLLLLLKEISSASQRDNTSYILKYISMCCCCRATETRVGNSAFYSLNVYYQSALEQGFFFPCQCQ